MTSPEPPHVPARHAAPESEDALLARARAGDSAALARLLEALGPAVRARVASKISSSMRAVVDEDDVMQVTYLEACLRLARFTTGNATQFLSWLHRLAENNLIDAVRAMEAARRPSPSKRVGGGGATGDSAHALIELLGVTHTTPSRHAARIEAAGALEAALRTLPSDYEKVIRQYDLEGRSAAEVAKELGRSEGAVFMLRARAHERLREAMGSPSQFFSSPA